MTHPFTIWAGAIVTLALFSYLVKDNIFYRIVQYGALGLAIGMGLVFSWQQVLNPMWYSRFSTGFRTGNWTEALWVLALIPGCLWYFQLSKKYFWVSTLVSGLFVGTAAGLAFKGGLLLILPQIGASLKPMNPFAGPDGFTWVNLQHSFDGLIFIVGMLTTLLYFFFSVKTDNALLRVPLRIGRIMIMIALGAMFGSTVMTRMAYLLDRLEFLYGTWLKPMFGA